VNEAGQIALWAQLADGRQVVVRADPSRPPVANGGPDQVVNEGDVVTLDGSGSSGLGCDPLSYLWVQLAGPSVSLNLADPVHPSFIAPAVPLGGATLTFELTVSDQALTSEPDTVDITIRNVNNVPIADAGPDQIVREGSLVTLDGSGSFDPDGEPLTYAWAQVAGSAVTLSDASAARPTFSAPSVGATGEVLTFELGVSDPTDRSAPARVNVTVENDNHAPVADAGRDQTVDEATPVTLDGTGSSDPDGDSLRRDWVQRSGSLVALLNRSSPRPSFTAPDVGPSGETLVFELEVTDDLGASASDQVNVTVLDVGAPPSCELAQPSLPTLWPPNHKLVAIQIVGVRDPDNQQVTIAVLSVTQDEPVNGLGDGDTSPDAVIQADQVLIRAERSGLGNGRVYQVSFRATDRSGESCTGTVGVCVPHDRSQTSCVDDGQLYDSTLP
jgi:hypothetical protein